MSGWPSSAGAQRAALTLIAAGLMIAAGAPDAPALMSRHDTEGLVRIIRPEDGQGIFRSGGPISLAARAGTRVRVAISGRDVTGALRLRGRTRLHGVIPQRLLSRVPRVLKVTARRGRQIDVDHALVRAVAQSERFLSIRLVRTGRGTAPVDAVMRTRVHRVTLQIYLNGRRIDTLMVSRRMRERRLRLTAAEGLRHGRNVLTVLTWDESGRGDVDRRVFTLPRSGPIPGVRAARAARIKGVVRLDARTSRASRANRRLSYRWRLIRRPRGSRARVSGAGRVIARLTPDRRGRYVMRLMVSERPAGASGAPGAARAVSTAVDVPLDAQTPVPPFGLALTADPASGLSVGGAQAPIPSGTGSLLVAVLDGTDGTILAKQNVAPAGSAFDLKTLSTTVLPNDTDPTHLLVLMGQKASTNSAYYPQTKSNQGQISTLSKQLQSLGLSGPDADDAVTRMSKGNPFTIIGRPGSAPGTAADNLFGESAGAGQLQGYLRPTGVSTTLTGQLVFTQPNFRRFALGGTQSSTMVTGENPGPDDKPAQALDTSLPPQPDLFGGGGMAVTVLDAVTLAPVASAVGNTGGANGVLTPVNRLLQSYRTDTSKLILFKMRSPIAWENTRLDMSPISQALAAMGGNRDLFLRALIACYGTSDRDKCPPQFETKGADYVFFGGAGVSPVEGSPIPATDGPPNPGNSPGPTPKTFQTVPASATNLTGILRRDEKGRWAPAEASTTDAIDQRLEAIANQQPTSYTYPTTPPGSQHQYSEAETQLYGMLSNAGPLCSPPSSTCTTVPGVRVNYANGALLGNLPLAMSALHCNDSAYQDTVPNGADYTADQVKALRLQVCSELAQLNTIHTGLFYPTKDNQSVYDKLEVDSTLDLMSDSSNFLGFLKDKEDADLSNDNKFLGISGEAAEILGSIVEGAVNIAEYALGPETGGGSILAGSLTSDFLSLGSSTLGVAGEAVDTDHLDPTAKTQITVGNLFKSVQTSYGEAAARNDELEALVATDPNKLTQVYNQVHSGAWNLAQNLPNSSSHYGWEVVEFQHRVAALQYMLPRMIDTVAKPCDTGGSSSDPTTYSAATQLAEMLAAGEAGQFLEMKTHQLRSAHLTSQDQHQLWPRVFGSPFSGVSDQIAAGPAGAAISRSPFFMVDIPSSQQVYRPNHSNECSEGFHP